MWLYRVVIVLLTEELAWVLWLTIIIMWNKSILLFDTITILSMHCSWSVHSKKAILACCAVQVCVFFRDLRLNNWMGKSSENTTCTQDIGKQTSWSPTGISTPKQMIDLWHFPLFSTCSCCMCWFIYHAGEWCVWRRSMWLDISIKNGNVNLRVSRSLRAQKEAIWRYITGYMLPVLALKDKQ